MCADFQTATPFSSPVSLTGKVARSTARGMPVFLSDGSVAGSQRDNMTPVAPPHARQLSTRPAAYSESLFRCAPPQDPQIVGFARDNGYGWPRDDQCVRFAEVAVGDVQ